jgi:FKBP-type peptidyl-prolyl cis-trans isomerase
MKSNLKFVLQALFCLLTIQAVSAQGSRITTEHGYIFTNHTAKPGPKAKYGEAVMVQVTTFIGDSLMGSTRSSGGARQLQLPEADKMPAKVPPIYDALVLMTKGDSATVIQVIDSTIRQYIPATLQNQKEIIYHIVVVDVITKEEVMKKQAEGTARLEKIKVQTDALQKDFKEGKLGDKLKKTNSGLQYVVHDMGKGKPITKGTAVKAMYYGCFTDGKMFDTSFERGEPLAFTAGIGQMIPGFDEGAQLLNHGGKATLFIPYTLGYGEEGTPGGPIPAKADLVFYIEVE